MLRQAGALFGFELRSAFRRRADIANPLWFFLMVITLFSLMTGTGNRLPSSFAPGVIWIAALLSSLLALDRLFRDDLRDGSLEQLMLLPLPLTVVVLVKTAVHWLVTGLPLLLLSPLAALLLGMEPAVWRMLALTLLIGTPVLSLTGAPGVALTAGLKRSGVLLSMLFLPLTIPLLIFSMAAADSAAAGQPAGGQLAALGALLAGSLTLSPFATAAALRITLR